MFPGIGSLTAMVELDFSHNKLETLPDTLAQLKQMTKIEAHHNLFYRIPHVLTQLTEIDQLNLQECEIKTLDVSVVHAFSQLPNLKILDLRFFPLPELFLLTLFLGSFSDNLNIYFIFF